MTVFNGVELTPINMEEVPPKWRGFLDVSRPDVSKLWTELGLHTSAGGPPTPGGILANLEVGRLAVSGDRLVAAPPRAKRPVLGLPMMINGEPVPPVPTHAKKAAMAANRTPLDKRPNWAFVIKHRSALRYSDCAALLGCSEASVNKAVSTGRMLPSKGGEQ